MWQKQNALLATSIYNVPRNGNSKWSFLLNLVKIYANSKGPSVVLLGTPFSKGVAQHKAQVSIDVR
jgi:hypothetical protein